MITVNRTSRDFTEVEEYLMTISPAIISMKDVEDNTKITVAGVLEFTDKKDNGDETEIMSIITPENAVYSCQSNTFKRAVHDIMRIMKDKPFTLIKTSGTTKAGRPYINAILDVTPLS